jgi:MYXO-CTERM domain-containing protein
MRRELLAVAIALTGLAAPRVASAFCRTTTVAAPPDHDPATCWSSGVPLYHPSQCLAYRLPTREAAAVSNATLAQTLATAFATWIAPSATCTPGITPIELSPTSATIIAEYRNGAPNENVFGFPDKWRHTTGETLALATLTFQADTGVVYDVDLEVNPEVAWATGTTIPADAYDLQSALTHEVGHVLGFAHSTAAGSAMTPVYTPGTTSLRKLASDDEQAICAVYPNRTQRLAASGLVPSTACDLAAAAPGGTSCDPQITHGCTVTASRPTTSLGAAAIAIGAALAHRRRRKAR